VTGEPTRRLAPNARWVWRLEQVAFWGVTLILALTVGSQLEDDTLRLLAWLLPLAGLVAGVALVPALRWRRWRWDVRPDAIDIQRGTLTIRRTLIPMLRVQHVETTRGVLEQAFQLATVAIHTAAGSHTIPLLGLADAADVRDRIADLARTADEP
jgi:membrane protein YdbS with pleckstrin-like domain